MKKFIIIAMLMHLCVALFSQNIFTGFIHDSDGHDIPGANVFIPEIGKGAAASKDGSFRIEGIPNGKFTVQSSFVGYETRIHNIIFSGQAVNLEIILKAAVIESEEIVVSAGSYTAQHDNAIKIESIRLESMEKTGKINFFDQLATLPGINVISKGEGIGSPVIRGLSMRNIIVLNNGIRTENFQFSENHPYLINPFGIEKTEVIKGPASLIYGSDALGGVINFIKEKPAPAGEIHGKAKLGFNSNTLGYQTGLGIKGSGKKLFWGINGYLQNHSDYVSSGGNFVPNSRFNTQSLSVFSGLNQKKGSYRLYYDFNAMKPGLVIPSSVEAITEQGRNNEMWYQDLQDHLVVSKNKIFLNTYQVNVNLSMQHNHRQLKTNPNLEDFIDVDMQLQTFTWLSSVKKSFTSGSIDFAYQGSYQENINSEAPSHVLPDFNLMDHSLYGMIRYQLAEKLNLQSGIRFDMRSLHVPEQKKTSHSHDDEGHDHTNDEMIEALNRDYQNISGSFGLTYELNEHLLLRANAASGFRSPHVSELVQDGLHGNRYEVGDRDLVSQRSFEYDISSHLHLQRIKLDIAAFYNRINHYIYITPTSDTSASGYQIFKYVQNDAALYGFESAIEYRPLQFFKVNGSFEKVIGKQDDGNHLPFIPQDKYGLGIQFIQNEIAILSDIFIGINANYYDQQDTPALFETASESYFLVDINLGVSYLVKNNRFDLIAGINNLLDESYINHLSTLKTLGFGNMGRNFSVSLRFGF